MSEAIKIQAGYTDYSEAADCKSMVDKIREVLRRHYECNSNGDPNPEFDDCFTSGDAVDAIAEIVGEF